MSFTKAHVDLCSMESKEKAKAELNRVIEDVRQRRLKVVQAFDEAAYDAACVLMEQLGFYGEDDHEFRSQEMRSEAARDILDRAGFPALKKLEHSGQVAFEPLRISREGEGASG